MKIKLLDLDNQEKGEVQLNPALFDQGVRPDLMHRVIVWQMAKRRAGTHNTKEIGDVSGSTRKIYKQKGTGRARHGSLRAAQFRGGGIIFGPHPRDYTFSLNKKVRKLGLISALSLKKKEDAVIVLDELKVESFSTALMAKKLKVLGVSAALIIDEFVQGAVLGSVSGLYGIDVLPVAGLNVLDILRHEKLVLTVNALKKIEERLL